MLTYFRTEDAVVTISDVARAKLADEQRHPRGDPYVDYKRGNCRDRGAGS